MELYKKYKYNNTTLLQLAIIKQPMRYNKFFHAYFKKGKLHKHSPQ